MPKQPYVSNEIILSLNDWKKKIKLANHHIPFVTVRDVNKIGRRHWIYCPRQQREVHLLSDGELGAYKILLWQPNTVEVKEQYPLDVDETFQIACAKEYIHPRDWKKNKAHVMTTDFVVTIREGNKRHKTIAYTFKYWNQIYKKKDNGEVEKINQRTWQKFEIEASYWGRRGIDYRIITERDTTKARVWNINYFELAHDLKTTKSELSDFGKAFISSWSNNPNLELQDHLNSVSSDFDASFQHCQSLFQYSGLHHLLRLRTTEYIRLFRPVEILV
jgi:hypothetical protein|tara:strand:- start:785 stop:1609 length:825 start_codon:yes stop_codon:yes gene_type:complete